MSTCDSGACAPSRRCGEGVSAADPYETLGVAPGADQGAIKAAYLRLMREHHPDRSAPGDAAAAKRAMEINAAYDLLRNGPRRPSPSGFDARPDAPSHRPGVAPRFRGPSIAARAERLRNVRRFRLLLLIAAAVLALGGVVGLTTLLEPDRSIAGLAKSSAN